MTTDTPWLFVSPSVRQHVNHLTGICFHRYLVRVKPEQPLSPENDASWRGKIDVTGEGKNYSLSPCVLNARTRTHIRAMSRRLRGGENRGRRGAEQRESFRWPFKARTFRSVTVFRVQRCATPQGDRPPTRRWSFLCLSFLLSLSLSTFSLASRRLHCFINGCSFS